MPIAFHATIPADSARGLASRHSCSSPLLALAACGSDKPPPTPGVTAPAGDGGPTTPCGGPGQPCCPANTCEGRRLLRAGVRRRRHPRLHRGRRDLRRAAARPAPATTAACATVAGAPCGLTGQPCCGLNATGGGGFCSGDSARCTMGTCLACGGAGQLCCQGGDAYACSRGLQCLDNGMDAPDTCGECGGPNQRCCADDECSSGLTCAGGGAGVPDMCLACGGTGQPCCDNDTCGAGLGCSDPPNTDGSGNLHRVRRRR